jgi:excisionase family DNA binding protein
MEPNVESDSSIYCSVASAAKLLGKSDRHVQRMLKEGTLTGHKVASRNGLKWMVDREALAKACRSDNPESALTDQFIVFESKFEMIQSELQILKQRVHELESERAGGLMHFEPEQDCSVVETSKTVKQSWWHRVFSPQPADFNGNGIASGAT